MIYDQIIFSDVFTQNHPLLREAMEYLRQCPADKPEGRYTIRGEDIYASVFTYQTGPAATKVFEGHRRYIDIQVVLSGVEMIDMVSSEGLSIKTPYDAEKDVIFYDSPKIFSSIVLRPGFFALLGPQDLHRPGVCLAQPETVRKLVIKVRV